MSNLLSHVEVSEMSNSTSKTAHILTSNDDNSLGGTAFSLDFLGYRAKSVCTPCSNDFLTMAQDDGCGLVLGLGPTPTSYSCDYRSPMITGSKESLNLFSQNVVSESDSSMLKLGLSGISTGPASMVIEVNSDQSHLQAQTLSEKLSLSSVVDEGSTSAKSSGGYMPTLLFAPRLQSSSNSSARDQLPFSPEPSSMTDGSVGGILDSMNIDTVSYQRSHYHHPKKCRFKGSCSKGARGASGLCIAHGGGQRCQKLGCNKGAESRTAFCKAHGGGRRCQMLGCTKSAEGKTDYCIAHGGGRRCGHPGCSKAARGKSGLCIRHGGGKRCNVEGCTRSAEGQAGLCISHGGGRRCQHPGCTKGAQGSTMFCKAHGGGKRCIFEGCTKGAEGSTPLCKGHGGGKRCLFEGGGVCPKSVHGGTNFCVAHGGGKRCHVPGCTKSARGRTDFCVRHGGGKRCHIESCSKSAQGSTDYCKAHGGGKRCIWDGGCEKFARGKSGLCASHGSIAALRQERDGMKIGGMIGPSLFKGIVSTTTSSIGVSTMDNEHSSSSGVSVISNRVESTENAAKRRKQLQLIPDQLLVPLSMKCPAGREGVRNQENRNSRLIIPEGRVHGGGLLSLLGGNLKNAVDGGMI